MQKEYLLWALRSKHVASGSWLHAMPREVPETSLLRTSAPKSTISMLVEICFLHHDWDSGPPDTLRGVRTRRVPLLEACINLIEAYWPHNKGPGSFI